MSVRFADGPVWDGYFADPDVIALAEGAYAAYGTGTDGVAVDGSAFEALWSADLHHWESSGRVLRALPEECGDQYWAPEVTRFDDGFLLFFSVGHGIDGHHLRVARGAEPFGPFEDLGVNLTPDERFAIDAHPFQGPDGSWYLFFARDVLDHERPGTHLAVAPLLGATRLGPIRTVLAPHADWQLYQRQRPMYGARYDWHTLEGPFVVFRHGRYWLTYSGGAWTGPGYAVSWAVADHPLGPWRPAPAGERVLASDQSLIGPGHNSIVGTPDGDAIAFHAWDPTRTKRQLHLRPIEVGPERVRLLD